MSSPDSIGEERNLKSYIPGTDKNTYILLGKVHDKLKFIEEHQNFRILYSRKMTEEYDEYETLYKIYEGKDVENPIIRLFGIIHEYLCQESGFAPPETSMPGFPGGIDYDSRILNYLYEYKGFDVSILSDNYSCYIVIGVSGNVSCYKVLKIINTKIPSFEKENRLMDLEYMAAIGSSIANIVSKFCQSPGRGDSDKCTLKPVVVGEKASRREPSLVTKRYHELKKLKGDQELSPKVILYGIILYLIQKILKCSLTRVVEGDPRWPVSDEKEITGFIYQTKIVSVSVLNNDAEFFVYMEDELDPKKNYTRKVLPCIVPEFSEDSVEKDQMRMGRLSLLIRGFESHFLDPKVGNKRKLDTAVSTTEGSGSSTSSSSV